MTMSTIWTHPSVALAHIESLHSGPVDKAHGNWYPDLALLAGLVETLSHVDERIVLETLNNKQLMEWRSNLAVLRSEMRRAETGRDIRLTYEPLKALHRLLKLCPDQIVPRAGPRLTFIADARLRESIARDVDSLEGFLRDSEWKAATVIGGSVVEALLLAGLLDRKQAAEAFEKERNAADPRRWKIEPLEDWKLWKMITVAEAVGLINDVVARVCDGARDFRNLIHAGKERAEAPSDKGTAHTAVAAVENLLATFSGERR